MALDGIVISNLVNELNTTLCEGHIQKIAQPEKDELLLTVKKNRINYRVVLSAGAALPLVYISKENKTSPLTAPNFCMLLRKHLNGARILGVKQISMERVIEFELENLNDMGDLTTKSLIIELMGKHSNIIFLNENRVIVDSIKHVSAMISSVREVLPGKEYFIPNTMNKLDPLQLTKEDFFEILKAPLPLAKALYTHITGFSSLCSQELAFRAGLDGDTPCANLSEVDANKLFDVLGDFINQVKTHQYTPTIFFDGPVPCEFSSYPLTIYKNKTKREFQSISEVLIAYYGEKDVISRIRQKSSDLRKIVQTIYERDLKKLELQQKQMKDTEKRDKYKVYGELLNTYGYQLSPQDKSLTCMNYYDNKEITIPVDSTLTPAENANKYFNRYNKLKRTYEALSIQMEETKSDIDHLESIQAALDIARKEEDLAFIKEELIQSNYIKKKGNGGKKGRMPKSKPLHFLSSDGFDIYVGKNNFQNDELTFKFASGGDWWFHAKNIAGSHVIVKADGVEPPIKTFEEAASLAAYFSKARGTKKVEIDYTLKKNVKKPNASKPGFVVYYTNYSLVADSDISRIELISTEDQIFLERSYL